MTTPLKRAMLTLASGSALAIAPLLYGTVVVPAISHAAPDTDSDSTQAKGLNCPDGTIVDEENHQCVDLVAGISKQLQALPAPPSLAGMGGGDMKLLAALGAMLGFDAGVTV